MQNLIRKRSWQLRQRSKVSNCFLRLFVMADPKTTITFSSLQKYTRKRQLYARNGFYLSINPTGEVAGTKDEGSFYGRNKFTSLNYSFNQGCFWDVIRNSNLLQIVAYRVNLLLYIVSSSLCCNTLQLDFSKYNSKAINKMINNDM